jgi:hypothetical protein
MTKRDGRKRIFENESNKVTSVRAIFEGYQRNIVDRMFVDVAHYQCTARGAAHRVLT